MQQQKITVSLTEQRIVRTVKTVRTVEVVKVKRKRRKLKKEVKAVLALLVSVWIGLSFLNDSQANEKPQDKSSVSINEHFEKKEIVVEPKESLEKAEETKFVYDADIPMPEDHQRYLFEKCEERGLDYQKALALIKHESNFNQNAVSDTNDYGYFQINEINRKDMARKLDTADSPLNPIINIEWGTYMLSDLYMYWEERGLSGQELDHHVWSSYNKGINGFAEHGFAVKYIDGVEFAYASLQ